MGSQLTKSYDVEPNMRTSGGINGAWKVFSATKKDKSRQRVSIFMFDKRIIEKKKSTSEREDLVQKLKNEVAALVRIRHPSILKVVEPLMEDSKTLAFVTEHVESCLGDLMRKPVVLASEFSDMESRLGLLDLAQALHFLHSEARMVHTAVCPDNVYVVEGGKWKLAGLGFYQQLLQDQTARIPDNIDLVLGAKAQRYAEGDVPSVYVPSLHFSAPEIVGSHTCSSASDLFSLGCLVFSLYKAASSSTAIDYHFLRISDFSETGHKNACTEAQYSVGTLLTVLPEDFREIVARLTAVSPNDRPSLHNFSVSRPFLDPFIKSLYFLEHIQEKQETQKVQFLKGLSKVIEKFDPRLLLKRVLPVLVSIMEQDTLAPSVLPNLLGILKHSKVPSDQFQSLIWPAVVKLATGKEIPAQCLFLLLGDMDLLMNFSTQDQCKQVLMPLVFKGYDCGVAQLQELVLKKTPEITGKINDTSFLKVQLLPRFLQALIAARVVSVREAGLRSLSKIYHFFDRSTLVDTVLPMLEKVRKLDVSSEICMQLLEVYEGIGKMLGHRSVALNILPSIIPLLVESDLTKGEFQKLCSTIENLTALVKEARTQELLTIREVEPRARQDPGLEIQKEDDSAETFFREMFNSGALGEDQANIFAGMEAKEEPRLPSVQPAPAVLPTYQQPTYSGGYPQTQPVQSVPALVRPQYSQPVKSQFTGLPPPQMNPVPQLNPVAPLPSFPDQFSQPPMQQFGQDPFPMNPMPVFPSETPAPYQAQYVPSMDRGKTPPRLQKPPSQPTKLSDPAPFNQPFPSLTLAQPTPIWSPPTYSSGRQDQGPDLFAGSDQYAPSIPPKNNPFAGAFSNKPPQYPADPFFGL